MSFNCTSCELHKTRGKNYCRGIGSLTAELFIIGDSPSGRDSVTGVPFSGRDKDVLGALLTRIGLKRNQVFTTNLLQCAPPADSKGVPTKPTPAQFEACWANLEKEIAAIKPKVILLLGAGPASVLLGAKTLGSVAGRVHDSAAARGVSYALSGEKKNVVRGKAKVELLLNKPDAFKVLATYSPAAALRDPSRLAEIERTFDTVGELLSGKVQDKATYDYKYAYTEPQVFEMLQTVLERSQVMHTMQPEGALSFDIETSGLNWYKRMFGSGHVSQTISIAFCFKPFEAFAVSLRPQARSPRVLKLLKEVLEHPVRKCGHNGRFDNVFLRGELGIRVANFAWDTMIAAYHLNQEGELGLDKLSPIFRPDLGYYWEEIGKQWLNRMADGKGKDLEIGYLYAPDPELLTYNARDVDATQSLYIAQQSLMREWGAIEAFTVVSMPHSLAIEDMEFNGIGLDVERCIEMGKRISKEAMAKEREALSLVGRHPHWWGKDCEKYGVAKADYKEFNIASSKQLGVLLFDELGLKSTVKSEKTQAPSVGVDALESLKDAHPFVSALLEYRKLHKQLSTYLGWEIREDGTDGPKTTGASLLALVGADGRIRPHINLTSTGTGRVGCASPNLQNQPKEQEFQNLFYAGPGRKFVDNDFSALELRVVALLANDEAMLDIFRRGIDPHSATAARMFGLTLEDFIGLDITLPDGTTAYCLTKAEQKEKYPNTVSVVDRKDRKERKAAKAINFGIVYGEGAAALAADLGVDKAEAERWLTEWSKAYPGITRFIAQKHQEVHKFGYVSYSLGRRRPIPGGLSDDKFMRAQAERASVNSPVQGSGADCTSIAIIRIRERLAREVGPEAKLVLEIHDAIIVDCLEADAEKVQAIMLEEMRRPMPMLSTALPLDATSSIKDRLGDK